MAILIFISFHPAMNASAWMKYREMLPLTHLFPHFVCSSSEPLCALAQCVCDNDEEIHVNCQRHWCPSRSALVLPSSVWIDSPRSAIACKFDLITSVVSDICAWISVRAPKNKFSARTECANVETHLPCEGPLWRCLQLLKAHHCP